MKKTLLLGMLAACKIATMHGMHLSEQDDPRFILCYETALPYFLEAVEREDVDRITALLQCPQTRIRIVNDGALSKALLDACKAGNIDIVQALLNKHTAPYIQEPTLIAAQRACFHNQKCYGPGATCNHNAINEILNTKRKGLLSFS